MNPKDVSYNWLSSGGAYFLIFLIWTISIVYFAAIARSLGRKQNNTNDGCLLTIATTAFALVGGALGLVAFNGQFPWFIFSSAIGSVLGPAITVRAFKSGKRKY